MHGKLAEIGDNSGDTAVEQPVVKKTKPYVSMITPNSAFDESRLRREDPRWFNTDVTADEAEKRAEWARFNLNPLTSTPPGGSKLRVSGGSVTHIVHPLAIDDTGPVEVKQTADELARSVARTARAAALEPAELERRTKVGDVFRASLKGNAPKAG